MKIIKIKYLLFSCGVVFSACSRTHAPQTVFSFTVFHHARVHEGASAGKLVKYKGARNDSLFLFFASEKEGWKSVLVARDIHVVLRVAYANVCVNGKKYYRMYYGTGDTVAIGKPQFTHDCESAIE